MGRLGGDVQALAIGLLNMADDEGYFLADPSSVRSALRPFDEDSTSIRRGLDELSRAGWVAFRTHPEMGLVGQVVKFCSHQRIDRSTPSKLKKYWDSALDESSSSPRRVLDESSLLEGNREQGREGKGAGGGEGASPAPLQLESPALKPVRPKAAPDPAAEFDRFVRALTPDEASVFDAYEQAFGVRVAADWGLKAFVAKKLKTHTAGELVAAVRGAARDPWHREKGSTLRALLSDATKVAQLAKRGTA